MTSNIDDVLAYSALVEAMQAATDETRRLEIWQEIELLKERYGGKVPKALEAAA